MAIKSFKGNYDLEKLSDCLEDWFERQEFETQLKKTADTVLLQAKKSSTLRASVGGTRAFVVLVQRESSEITIEMSSAKWTQNLTAVGVSALITGGVSLLVGGMIAGWTKKIEADLWEYIEGEIRFSEDLRMPSHRHLDEDEAKECPFCAETIKFKAIFCKHCQRDLVVS